MSKEMLVRAAAGPLLVVTIPTYSASVTKGDTGVSFIASIENRGTTDAAGVYLNWTLPAEFTLASGVLQKSIGNLPVDGTSTNSITIDVDASSDDKTVNISAVGTGTNANSSSASRVITIGSPTVVTEEEDGDGGGGGGGGFGSGQKILSGEEVVETEERIDLIRGESDKFYINISNLFQGTTLDNVSVSISGFLSRYLTLSPSFIEGIEYDETSVLEVMVDSPEYLDFGEHNLVLSIDGVLVRGRTTQEFKEVRDLLLVVHRVSDEQARDYLEEARKAIEEMEEEEFNIDDLSGLLSDAEGELSNRDYEDVESLVQEIISLKDMAFETNDVLDTIKSRIDRYGKVSGIFGTSKKFPETEEILNLALAAFERGDYETALERAKTAELTLALESKEFRVLFFLIDYWWVILLSLLIFVVGGYFGYKYYVTTAISRKIIALDREEDTVLRLIRKLQKDYFKKRTISPSVFRSTLSQYKKRLTRIRQTRTKLRHKRVRLLDRKELIKDLEKERKEVVRNVKNIQKKYYAEGKMSQSDYKEQQKVYNARLAEIEDEQETIKRRVKKKKHRQLMFIFMFILFLFSFQCVLAEEITGEDALNEINKAEEIMKEMEEEGLSINFVNDTIYEAKLVFEKAGDSPDLFSYSDVLEYTSAVEDRRELGLELLDRIGALSIKIEDYSERGINISEGSVVFDDAVNAFENERYGETEDYLDEANFLVESARSEATTLNLVLNSGKSFFVKYWYELVLVVVILAIIIFISWGTIRRKMLKNKIKYMEAEEKVLVDLIKKTQERRYMKRDLPASVYELRMEKYNEKLNEIRHTLPVLKTDLRKKRRELLRKKKVKKRAIKRKAKKKKVKKRVRIKKKVSKRKKKRK